MLIPGLILFAIAFALGLAGTFFARRWARRMGLMDAPGHRKVHTVATPRNGGIGIFWGFAIPLLAGVGAIYLLSPDQLPGTLAAFFKTHAPGLRSHAPLALLLLATTFGIHLLGLLDDRAPMNPWPKLLSQVAFAAALVLFGEALTPGAFRIMTMLGDYPSPGFFISVVVSIVWIVALTNAFNFLDNMDGLSAGVAFIGAGMFLIAAIINEQYFVIALLLIFMGSILGFLCFNFPPASIFMGDGGSMVLGFLLAALTIRTTFYQPGRPIYAVLMPLFVMAVPLYDLVIVSVLRLMKGRSPMTGDTNHFSHRLTRHGFSKRTAVLIIYAVSLATGFAAPLLARLQPNDNVSALLLAGQLFAILIVIGILERVGDHTT